MSIANTSSSLSPRSVEGVFVGSQLWYLPRRPVHRHRLRRQEGHSLRSHLLNYDWLKKKQTKKKTTNNQGAGPRLPPAPVTVQSIGGMENKRHSTPTLLFCLRLWKKWEGVKGSKGAQSHISGKKQTVFNALRTLVRLELRKCGFLQRTFVFVPFFPFFNKIKPL